MLNDELVLSSSIVLTSGICWAGGLDPGSVFGRCLVRDDGGGGTKEELRSELWGFF